MEGGRLEGKRENEDEYKWWLTAVPNVANDSILGKAKFWDMVLLKYKIVPKDLPRCGKCHTLQHSLQCNQNGLIGAHHDDKRDDLGLTTSQAYSPSAIRDDPKVIYCRECKNG
eukprot:955597-Ditylum_brightwellii.AAC.1